MSDRESIAYDVERDAAARDIEEFESHERAFWLAVALPCPGCDSKESLGVYRLKARRAEVGCGECDLMGIGPDVEGATDDWNSRCLGEAVAK